MTDKYWIVWQSAAILDLRAFTPGEQAAILNNVAILSHDPRPANVQESEVADMYAMTVGAVVVVYDIIGNVIRIQTISSRQ